MSRCDRYQEIGHNTMVVAVVVVVVVAVVVVVVVGFNVVGNSNWLCHFG